MRGDKLYDIEKMLSLYNGNQQMVTNMIKLFIEHTPQSIKQINTLYHKGDLEGVGANLHKIKPALSMMGMAELDSKVREAESNIKKSENLDSMSNLIRDIDELCGKIVGELKAHVATY